jgi:sugar-specific transcriptional regulator TrmB
MDRDQLLNALSMMGLTNREAEVFLTILERGEASVKDILESVDIHQPQLYNILTSLLRRGFIKVSSGRPKLYSAYSLPTIIDTYISTLTSVKELIKGAKRRRNEGQRIYMTYGIDGINNGIVEVLNNAEVEVYGEIPVWLLKRNLRSFIETLRRDVRLYLIVYPSLEGVDLSTLKDHGDQVWIKVNRLGDFLLLAADLSIGIYASRRSTMRRSDAYGYVLYDTDMLARLMTIFTSTWRESEDALYINPEEGKYPRRFLSMFFAILTIQALLSRGHNPVVVVKGTYLKNGEPVELRGRVSNINMYNRVSNIVLNTGNAQYSIGGYDAELEDIEAREIVIESLN